MNNMQTRFGIVVLVLIAVIGFMLGRSTKTVISEREHPKNAVAEIR
jgi:uncharacterized membrane protein YoaK (UPF0700 family)